MKMYTSNDQTSKLIELGLSKPKSEVKATQAWDYAWFNPAYSIGELIEMLGVHLSSIYYIGIEWFVNAEGMERRRDELIDALFAMIVMLKDEGVI